MDVVICMPLRDEAAVQAETAHALQLHTPPHRILQVVGLPIREARMVLAQKALALTPEPEFVLWIDSDAWWEAGAVEDLVATLRSNPRYAMICAAYGRRERTSRIVAYPVTGGGRLEELSPWFPGANYALGDLIDIVVSGLHFNLVRTSALRDIGPDCFTIRKLPEDFSFCQALLLKGYRLACATGISVGHIDRRTGLTFVPGKEPFIVEIGMARDAKTDAAKD